MVVFNVYGNNYLKTDFSVSQPSRLLFVHTVSLNTDHAVSGHSPDWIHVLLMYSPSCVSRASSRRSINRRTTSNAADMCSGGKKHSAISLLWSKHGKCVYYMIQNCIILTEKYFGNRWCISYKPGQGFLGCLVFVRRPERKVRLESTYPTPIVYTPFHGLQHEHTSIRTYFNWLKQQYESAVL